MPHYPDQHPVHPDHSLSPKPRSKSTPLIVTGDLPDMTALPHQSPRNLTDLLEPAVDGPPSPERIRQLNDQMKRATHLNRAYGHRVASSSSSSLLVTDRHGWNHSMENISLSRRSSNRSAASGSPSRDLPDGGHGLSKNIFHRRAKSSKSGRTSANSSSGSSLYSTEAPSEHSLANFKDSLMPTIFNRRKMTRDEMMAQRKLQISGPFNFQHITHTPREQVANLQRSNRRELMDELSTLRVSGAVGVAVTPDSSETQEFHFSNHSAEQLYSQDVPHPQAGPRRMVKYTRSQEQLRTSAPVRPPRSPVEQIASPGFGPPPPPRISSRQSAGRNGSPVGEFDRPLTGGGFCRPRPFSPNSSLDASRDAIEEIDPLATTDGPFSHALTTPDDAAWPLPGPTVYERPLPDVPEEDEHPIFTHRSHGSVASNASSLRAIQSVPALRTVSAPQRMSGASDTLGPFETVNRLSQVGQIDCCSPASPLRESWEDDIDYCYEHEADANFDYQWERPSIDNHGDRRRAPPVQVALVDDDELNEAPSVSLAPLSPGMLSASRYDVPALSPTSIASPIVSHEVTTPVSATGVSNNFSLPRVERSNRPPHLKPTHERTDSRASSFKESHGFTLSPSLLIPGDYHHQMMLTEADRQEFAAADDEFRSRFYKSNAFFEENIAAAGASPFMQQQRSSVSTTATNSTTISTAISDSTGERHVSTNSTWTALTRLTSSTSLSKMTGSWSESAGDQAPSTQVADAQEDSDREESTPPATKDTDTVPELVQFPVVPAGHRSHHKSHASESIVRDEVPTLKADAAKPRRPRARTTSMSVQAPPVGQYALFPRTYVKTTGDRI